MTPVYRCHHPGCGALACYGFGARDSSGKVLWACTTHEAWAYLRSVDRFGSYPEGASVPVGVSL